MFYELRKLEKTFSRIRCRYRVCPKERGIWILKFLFCIFVELFHDVIVLKLGLCKQNAMESKYGNFLRSHKAALHPIKMHQMHLELANTLPKSCTSTLYREFLGIQWLKSLKFLPILVNWGYDKILHVSGVAKHTRHFMLIILQYEWYLHVIYDFIWYCNEVAFHKLIENTIFGVPTRHIKSWSTW